MENKKSSKLGTASLVLGIVGFVLSCIIIGIIPCIIGAILAIVALTKKDEKHGTAVSGLIICIIGILMFFIMFIVIGSSSDDKKEIEVVESVEEDNNEIVEEKKEETTESSTAETITEEIKEEKETDKEETITYVQYSVSQMMSDLDSNALKAEKTYSDAYVEITGRLNVIDSDGDYISLVPTEDEWAIMGITCYIKNDKQLEQVMEMSIDDTVTLRGQITSIGEVLGYSLDIDEIL